MRTAVDEKEDQKSLKQKTRERVRPKMGKLTIDYQKLHDAFFKWQTKPRMTIHGDLYYEVYIHNIHVHTCNYLTCINNYYEIHNFLHTCIIL